MQQPHCRKRRVPGVPGALAALLLAGMASPLQAQATGSDRWIIKSLPSIEVAATASRSAPGSSAASPTGFGANFGDGFIGAGYQRRARYTSRDDGSIATGFGLGNARDNIGAEITISSASTVRQGIGRNGSVSARLHRVVPRNLGLSIGVENAKSWGATDGGRSLFAVASRSVHFRKKEGDPFSTITVNVGAGNGRFRREDDVTARKQKFNPFASVGMRVAEPVGAIIDYTGQDLMLGLSIVPFKFVPLVISPTLADVTNSAGDGVRFTVGAGMGFKFGAIRNIFVPRPASPQ